jgi:hypothetical protein
VKTGIIISGGGSAVLRRSGSETVQSHASRGRRPPSARPQTTVYLSIRHASERTPAALQDRRTATRNGAAHGLARLPAQPFPRSRSDPSTALKRLLASRQERPGLAQLEASAGLSNNPLTGPAAARPDPSALPATNPSQQGPAMTRGGAWR